MRFDNPTVYAGAETEIIRVDDQVSLGSHDSNASSSTGCLISIEQARLEGAGRALADRTVATRPNDFREGGFYLLLRRSCLEQDYFSFLVEYPKPIRYLAHISPFSSASSHLWLSPPIPHPRPLPTRSHRYSLAQQLISRIPISGKQCLKEA
jgi:hypothetical protein